MVKSTAVNVSHEIGHVLEDINDLPTINFKIPNLEDEKFN